MSFRSVTGYDQGNFYAISNDGDLFYYRDEVRNGSVRWAFDTGQDLGRARTPGGGCGRVGQRIGTGWGDFLQVFPGGDGVIYAVNARGAILYYRDEARDGLDTALGHLA
jgi:hypothetical protein